MISKLIAHDRQLGVKDGYERREESRRRSVRSLDHAPAIESVNSHIAPRRSAES